AELCGFGLQHVHGCFDFGVLSMACARHQSRRCDEATRGQEADQKTLTMHVKSLPDCDAAYLVTSVIVGFAEEARVEISQGKFLGGRPGVRNCSCYGSSL